MDLCRGGEGNIIVTEMGIGSITGQGQNMQQSAARKRWHRTNVAATTAD